MASLVCGLMYQRRDWGDIARRENDMVGIVNSIRRSETTFIFNHVTSMADADPGSFVDSMTALLVVNSLMHLTGR